MKQVDYQLDLDNGKYTYIRYKDGGQEILRYGEKWRDVTGDNFIYLLAAQVESLTKKDIS